jgi:outer membrane protein OmpA-like peptidoglycan-associated protein
MMTIPFGQAMYEPPQIVFYSEKGFTDSEDWTELSREFIADGTESVMTIGAFEWKTETPVLINGISRTQNPPLSGVIKDVHYFVDDVSLAEVNVTLTAGAIADSLQVQPDTASAELKGTTIVLKNLLFENDRAVLKPEAMAQLNPLAGWLKSHPGSSVRIGGHTDKKGDDDHNMQLSQTRAEAVKAYLVSQGIAPERISAIGYGETQPIAPNDTKEGREQNRRVEISFL